jgi:hypothetical protein
VKAAKRLSYVRKFFCCVVCLCCCRVVPFPALFWFCGVAERKRCYARNFFRQEGKETGSFRALLAKKISRKRGAAKLKGSGKKL